MENTQRYHLIDYMRGFAVALMIYFHFCYDLSYFRFADFEFHHSAYWLSLRNFIVSLFLFIVGVSLQLARINNVSMTRISKRLVILLACALLITITSKYIFADRFIWFGILHFILVASIIGVLLSRYPRVCLLMGPILLLLGNTIRHPFFDQGWTQWIGMMTFKPPTEDYVPLIPWLGVVLIGSGCGYYLLAKQKTRSLLTADYFLPARKLLCWFGKHSLIIYMLHQPLFFAVLGAFA